MAEKATAEGVQRDLAPPNYRGAVQRIRSVKAKKDKISSVNGEIADIFAKVEGMKVNRKAAKIFAALDTMEHPERMDIMRSLQGLIDASEWGSENADLLDQAEGNVVRLPTLGAGADEIDEALEEEGELGGDEIDEFEATEAELAKQSGRSATAAAKERARKAIAEPAPGTGAAAIAAMKGGAPSEPFTGDNSDLAGGEDAA